MKKLIRFVVFLVIIAAALAIFKPTESDFEVWVKKEGIEKREKAKGENVVEKLVDKGVTTATQLQLLATYRYTNHYLVAVVDANANGKKMKFIGIATLWIPVPFVN